MKVFFAVAALAVLASCSKNELAEVNPEAQNVVKFDNYLGKTKAAEIAGIDALKPQGFKVYADIYGATFGSFMSNLAVTWSTDWSYTGDYSWVNAGTNINFYAYSTSQALTANASGLLAPTIAATAAGQDDILIAAKVTQASGTVNFAFTHALSQVDFKIDCGEGTTATINSFEIQGVNTASASLSLLDKSWATPSGAALSTAYTYGGGATTPAFPISVAANGSSNAISGLGTPAPGAFMLIPQDILAWNPNDVTPTTTVGARIKINYTLSFDGVAALTNVDAYFPIPSRSWVPGTKYLYTLTLSKNVGGGYDEDGNPLLSTDPIEFNVTSVSDWGTSIVEDPLIN